VTHLMLPAASHDELAEQMFVRDFKVWLGETGERHGPALAAQCDPGDQANDRLAVTWDALHEVPAFREWLSLRRQSQDLLWDAVARSVERQRAALDDRAVAAPPLGSLQLDPGFVQPDPVASRDIHLMPGGYQRDDGGVGQGAIMDRGGAVYMLGRNGGFMNDGRGRTALQHLYACWPGFAPARILELGCGIGASTVPFATAFPQAEVHGLDVGASMLRYALARARHLGTAIHFTQGDATAAPYPDASFDLVFSCALFHETSRPAIDAILTESRRLLRPGGIAIHLEVPQRIETMGLWGMIRGRIEAEYNNEPAWEAAISADYAASMRVAGFAEVITGYQDMCMRPDPAGGGFGQASKGVFGSWFVVSGRA
jgi:ubiquinone/menaquinone biosynthesis C-methylase UbiE